MSNWSNRLLIVLLVGAAACSSDPQKLKRRYLESGDSAVKDRKFNEAIIQYRNAVGVDPRWGEARFKLAAAYADAGNVTSALAEYIRAADLLPKDIEAQLRAGNGLLAAGKFPEAKARAMAALALDPKNVRGLALLGDSMAGMKDLDGAITKVKEAIDADPHETLTYANLGALQMAKGDRAAAETTFKRAVEIEPQSASAHMALANFYWATAQKTDAERELKLALSLDPKSLSANRALAVFYTGSGRHTEAEPYMKAYADLASDVGPKLTLADFYVMRQKVPEARSVLGALLKTNDGYVPATIRLAALDFVDNRKTEAYQQLDEALKREPKNENALLEKGRFLLAEQKAADALAVANVVVAQNPRSAAGQYLRGSALSASRSWDDALKSFQEALRLDPGAVAAMMQLATVHLSLGDAAAAAQFATQAVKNQPTSGAAHLLLARALLRQGNPAGAEPHVLGVERGNPNRADVQTLLGEVYFAKGDFPRARTAFERALALPGNSVEALAGRIKTDLVQHEPKAARSAIEARLVETPNDPGLQLLAGDTFMALGDSKRAESSYQQVLRLDASSIEAYSRLGMIYGTQNRLEEAKGEYEEIAKRQPKAAAAATTMIGAILELQHKPEEARTYYQKALILDPRMPVAANNLAWDYADNGHDLDVALDLAQTARARLPENGNVGDTLGWVYYKKGLSGLAISTFELAAKQDPSNPTIHYHLGLAYLKSGDQKKARGSIEHALKLNPQFKDAGDAKRVLASLNG